MVAEETGYVIPLGLWVFEEVCRQLKRWESAGVPVPRYVAQSLKAGTLEMSNVDLSQEFTNLIIAQRGFQATSRVITTSDQVLEELVNIKR